MNTTMINNYTVEPGGLGSRHSSAESNHAAIPTSRLSLRSQNPALSTVTWLIMITSSPVGLYALRIVRHRDGIYYVGWRLVDTLRYIVHKLRDATGII